MMRKYIFILFSLVSFNLFAEDWDPCICSDCPNPAKGCQYTIESGMTSRTFELWGNVRVVSNPLEADITVYLVKDGGADLVVSWVDKEPDGCGQWRKVDSNENFTICFVNSRCDASFTIRYGNAVEEYPVSPMRVLPD